MSRFGGGLSGPSASFFSDTVRVERQQNLGPDQEYPVDGSAGRAGVFAPLAGWDAVPCSIQPETGRAAYLYAERNLEVDTAVYFRQVPPVQRDDRLVTPAGTVYVVQAAADECEQGRVGWVLCKRYR